MASEGWSTSHVVLAAVAMVVGLGGGRLSLQGELGDVRDALDQCETRPRDAGSEVGRQIARALGGERPVRASSRPRSPEQVSDPPEPEIEPIVEGDEAFGIEGPERPPEVSRRERLDAMADAVAMRQAQARQALLEQARPTDEQLAQIDDAFAEMNAILVDESEILLDAARDGAPTRREGLEFARNAIDALLQAEDALWDTLTDEQLDGVEPEVLDPLGFIDPAVVETLTALER